MAVADAIIVLFAAFAVAGLCFAMAFVSTGIGRVDPAARAGTLPFRILLLPGAVALWPWLLIRWIKCARRR